jgi:hypothetical protein
MNVDSSIFEAIVIPPGKAYKASKKFTQSQEKSSCDCPVRKDVVQFALFASLYAPAEYRRELIHTCLEIFENEGDDDSDDQIDDDIQRVIDRRNELINGQKANSLNSDALIELGVLELAYFDNVSLAQAIFEEAFSKIISALGQSSG